VPTWETTATFDLDLKALTPQQRAAFRRAVEKFVSDLRGDAGFRRSLRVKRVEATKDIWELSWAPDGRATWQYGPGQTIDEPHVVWRRVGSHDVFRRP